MRKATFAKTLFFLILLVSACLAPAIAEEQNQVTNKIDNRFATEEDFLKIPEKDQETYGLLMSISAMQEGVKGALFAMDAESFDVLAVALFNGANEEFVNIPSKTKSAFFSFVPAAFAGYVFHIMGNTDYDLVLRDMENRPCCLVAMVDTEQAVNLVYEPFEIKNCKAKLKSAVVSLGEDYDAFLKYWEKDGLTENELVEKILAKEFEIKDLALTTVTKIREEKGVINHYEDDFSKNNIQLAIKFLIFVVGLVSLAVIVQVIRLWLGNRKKDGQK